MAIVIQRLLDVKFSFGWRVDTCLRSEAGLRAERAARQAREAAEVAMRAAEEAVAKFGLVPKLVRQILSSREFVLIAILIAVGSIFAAVAISVGLSSLHP
jgi:hypothetical protein